MTLCYITLRHDVTSFAIHMFIGLFFQKALVDHIGVDTDTNNSTLVSIQTPIIPHKLLLAKYFAKPLTKSFKKP